MFLVVRGLSAGCDLADKSSTRPSQRHPRLFPYIRIHGTSLAKNASCVCVCVRRSSICMPFYSLLDPPVRSNQPLLAFFADDFFSRGAEGQTVSTRNPPPSDVGVGWLLFFLPFFFLFLSSRHDMRAT